MLLYVGLVDLLSHSSIKKFQSLCGTETSETFFASTKFPQPPTPISTDNSSDYPPIFLPES